MKKFFTFLLCVLFVSALSAQTKEAAVQEADAVPVIGGDLDAAWDQADPHNIDLVYQGANGPEEPTVGEEGETYWKALYTQDGIYVLVYVADDTYVPYYDRVRQDTTGGAHLFDNIEVFLDCNYVKQDGLGGHTNPNEGHYQLAPAHNTDISGDADWDNGTKYENTVIGYDYAVNADQFEPAYFYEFFLAWTNIRDKDGELADLDAGLGFEVAIADNDEGTYDGRNRMVWSNNLNGDNDSWDNMDDCGLITFDGYEVIYTDKITITGEDITVDNQTVTIGVELVSEQPPLPPTDQSVVWFIDEASTAQVKFDEKTGTITPLTDGTFIIYAEDKDGIVASNTLTINISNQAVEVHDVTIIVDGYNDDPQEDSRPNAAWETMSWNGYGDHTAYVEDGVLRFNSDSVLANTYSMKMVQDVDGDITFENKDVVWVAAWKMWADEDVAFSMHSESSTDWSSWAASTPVHTANAVPQSEGAGTWDISVTTEAEWFSVRFTAGNIKEDAHPYIGWQVGHVGATNVYMDSLYVVTVEDSTNLIDWDYKGIQDWVQNTSLSETTLKVYPNPASDLLNVSLSGVEGRTKVAIYNSVGIKMEEIEVFGNRHVFDVSNYSSGIYIVRAKDQFVKFVR